jgi:hypothetical protein
VVVEGIFEEVGDGEMLRHGDDDGVGVKMTCGPIPEGSDDFAGGAVGGEDDEAASSPTILATFALA